MNDRMAPTEVPVATAVVIETCAKPSNTSSYMLFFYMHAFFTGN